MKRVSTSKYCVPKMLRARKLFTCNADLCKIIPYYIDEIATNQTMYQNVQSQCEILVFSIEKYVRLKIKYHSVVDIIYRDFEGMAGLQLVLASDLKVWHGLVMQKLLCMFYRISCNVVIALKFRSRKIDTLSLSY